MLPYVRTSFVINVNQINHILITKDNRYRFSQWMKVFFVNFCFSSKNYVICDCGCMQLVECDQWDFNQISCL